MKKYKIEIELSEHDLEGDEFWEDAIEEDPTGINPLLRTIKEVFEDRNFFWSSNIKLKEYKDE